MKINDRVYVHGYVDEIRKDTVIIRNEGGYFGTVKSEIVEAQKTEDIVSVIRCKDCKYYRKDGDCWHEWDNDGRIYYQSIINEPNPDDYCSRAERKEDDIN